MRSQDKNILVKVDSLLIDDNNNDIYTQCWVGVNLETYTLGKYRTKERALEVLDEIQRQLIGKKGLITTQDKKGIEFIPFTDTVVVYEMPKE